MTALRSLAVIALLHASSTARAPEGAFVEAAAAAEAKSNARVSVRETRIIVTMGFLLVSWLSTSWLQGCLTLRITRPVADRPYLSILHLRLWRAGRVQRMSGCTHVR